MEERCFRIGELAKLVGVSQRTVDYYTRLGLIVPMQRTEGNYRIYDEGAVQRLHLIKAMQAQRIPLAEIAVKLENCPTEINQEIVQKVQAIGRGLAEAERELAALGVVAAGAAVSEDLRRILSRTAGEALLHSLILAKYLAALVGEGWSPP